MKVPLVTENQRKLIDLAYTRSCMRLEAQQQIANASDQRSLVFASLSIAAAALIFSAFESLSERFFSVGSALFFSLAAFSAALSALPQKHYSPGSHARDLETFIQNDTAEHSVLLGLNKNNDADADSNEVSARCRAHLYRFGIFSFILGIIIAAIGFISLDASIVTSGANP